MRGTQPWKSAFSQTSEFSSIIYSRIDKLNGLTALEELDLSNNQLTDVAALTAIISLKRDNLELRYEGR